MHIDEAEFETKMAQIVDQMEYLMMDIIFLSVKKINMKNQLLKELLEIRLKDRKEEKFYSFGETEPGSAGEHPGKG
ncbi:MAG TPA: hypothetical protein ENG35_02060 [Desulfobacteraceae bacterium]|nr:hypothetical protein [Desulfobacteraceae bacterium]